MKGDKGGRIFATFSVRKVKSEGVRSTGAAAGRGKAIKVQKSSMKILAKDNERDLGLRLNVRY